MKEYKFPRTPHLPFSPGFSGDDVRLSDISHLSNKRLVCLEKRDGENTTILSNGKYYARSIDSGSAEWRSFVGKLASEVSWQLPPDWRICGENMYAIHSIEYEDLESYFYVFAIFNEKNEEISWEETKEWCELLDLKTVKELVPATFCKSAGAIIGQLPKDWMTDKIEGYVIRNADQFPYEDYDKNVAKWVRENHVQTDQHWTKNWKPAKLNI